MNDDDIKLYVAKGDVCLYCATAAKLKGRIPVDEKLCPLCLDRIAASLNAVLNRAALARDLVKEVQR